MPEKLTSICNEISFNGDACQGFVYDTKQNIAFFKPRPANSSPDLCANPTTYTWLLTTNRGQLH